MTENTTYEYARQRFRQAVSCLATGHGSIQERVSAAFHALSVAISHDRVPGVVGEQLRMFAEAWSQSDDGSIDHWARDLTVDEAVEIANWVLLASYQVDGLVQGTDALPAAPESLRSAPMLGQQTER